MKFEEGLRECAALEVGFVAWLTREGYCPCEKCRYPIDRETYDLCETQIASMDWVVLGFRREFYESKAREAIHHRN